METLKHYLKTLNDAPFINKKIRVYGWQKEYDTVITSSILPYLFEPLKVIENIAPASNDNRDLRVKEKRYITIHDTGDSEKSHNASFWSNTVYNQKLMDTNDKYSASFQYVTGNDGCYHNLPDNEVGYHAGDGTKFDYKLYDTGVVGTNLNPLVEINEEGYFTIDKITSTILAPKYISKELERISVTTDINDFGILIKLIDGKYYIGELYFNETYKRICNRGGNNNSIGIESCINEGSDIYYTYQLTSKLIAKLLKEHKLSIDDLKPHHYFSGKPCPQTMIRNDLYNHFIFLVETEVKILSYLDQGYTLELICDDIRVNKNGRITLNGDYSPINYQIKITKGHDTQYLSLTKVI